MPAAIAGKDYEDRRRCLAEGISKAKTEGELEKGSGKGIQPGEQRGIRKGEREAALKIARSLLKPGIPHESVPE
ncbi:hypothetical protein GA0061070_10687 [Kosakonia oryziphila]|jgi:Putative transposase, YhgA-like.|uniref:Transposase n=1 Tax=Kosakonia oryziphila TaxID=1005667 RepID=A0A1C4GH26_9ENTR|nr:hypothetical protein GA0061070_10687 [Kosakonia oryziphila]